MDSSITTIAPHWSSSYPEYLSLTWDENMQRAVVWTRLQEHCKLANCSLSKQTERYHALRQEYQKTQVKSSHKLLSRDIKSNLLMASRAEQVFNKGLAINRRGEHNIPKKYLKAALYATEGDEAGYFVYYKGLCIPVEFDFTHCFWYIVKYDKQRSC